MELLYYTEETFRVVIAFAIMGVMSGVTMDGGAPADRDGGAARNDLPVPVESGGVTPREAGDGEVSPLFGRGALVSLSVWGVMVLGITGGIAGVTPLWPLLPVVGAAVPVALVFLAVWHAKNQREALKGREIRAVLVSDERAERELLGALLQSDGLTPAGAAARTSLGVTQAAGILERLAGKGHLDVAAVDGDLVYALRNGGPRRAPQAGQAADRREGAEGGASAKPPVEPLGEREVEVARMLASGMTNREIAGELYVSHGTVKAHTANIYRKLGVHNRAEMIQRARDLELLDG